ncbi:aldo/keto reductase [Algoriphagus sanaruensis]|uniref:Oxidoreductase n=1 Tax=Algoriphagus sanaruensis TaxID=1727163 RepID=A0A142EQH8_9BACT|nr:aldo/keto reductase [Algoriphagus sanaruensis]AMQ57383.1 oxidoreductase [Algoriphagus sanaruensis]
MDQIKIQNSLELSRIGLGCMSLPKEEKSALSILHAAIEAGMTYWDTADLYQMGWNEGLVGKILPSLRNKVTIATKGGNEWQSDEKSWSWNPRKDYLLKAVEESLRRLNIEVIDLYQLHGGTIEDPWDEVFETMEILKSQGKIKHFGISSIRPNVIRKVVTDYPPATLMLQYSPLDRRAEEFVFPFLKEHSTRVVVRGALAKGILLNKPADAYLGYSQLEVQGVKNWIQNLGFDPLAVLLRFGLEQSAVASLVIGASAVNQIEELARAYDLQKQVPSEVIDLLKSKYSANLYQEHC